MHTCMHVCVCVFVCFTVILSIFLWAIHLSLFAAFKFKCSPNVKLAARTQQTVGFSNVARLLIQLSAIFSARSLPLSETHTQTRSANREREWESASACPPQPSLRCFAANSNDYPPLASGGDDDDDDNNDGDGDGNSDDDVDGNNDDARVGGIASMRQQVYVCLARSTSNVLMPYLMGRVVPASSEFYANARCAPINMKHFGGVRAIKYSILLSYFSPANFCALTGAPHHQVWGNVKRCALCRQMR